MPWRGRIHRRAKEPRERYWGDELFFTFVNTLKGPEQEHIEQALQEYFPSQKSHFASYHSTRKYDRPQPVLNRQLWEISRMWTVQHFQTAMAGARLTSPSVYAWSLRPWTTPGFPFVWAWPTKGQALQDERFWDFYERYKAADFEWDVLWGSTVKSDELRPPEKIALSELRTFLSSPIHHNVALGEMCADMNERLKNSTSTWSTLGRSNFNREWHDTMSSFRHPHFYGADLSNQDASMFREAMLDQAGIRFEMYGRDLQTEQNWRRLSNLYIQIVYSLIVLAQGEVVEKDTGNPSGSGNTITDNTMILFRCYAYCWLLLWMEKYNSFEVFQFQDEFRYSFYMKHVIARIIGDDSLLNISEHAHVVFHIRAIVRAMWTLFVVLKPENEEPLTDFQELSFCSHTTKMYFGTYVPVMEYSRGVASLGWKGASLLHQAGAEVHDPSVHYTLQRALDIRREGFWNDRLFALADAFVRWLLQEHSALLSKPAANGPIAGKSLEDILASYLSEQALIYLYTGKETVVKQCVGTSGRSSQKRIERQFQLCVFGISMPPKSKPKSFKQRFHDAVVEPLESTADDLTRAPVRLINAVTGTHLDPLGTAFHKHVFTETNSKMSSHSKKKKSAKGKRKKRQEREKATEKAMLKMASVKSQKVKQTQRSFKKRFQKRGFTGSVIGATRAALPKLLNMKTSAGLTMKGGVISGVTEITSDLQLTSAQNVAGTMLYQSAIHPLLLAPGSRFADIAAMYDQYVFESFQVTLGSDIPFTLNGMIGGGVERDPGDPLPAAGTVGALDVPKYMEHSNFHAESIANKRGLRFPKDPRAVKKSGKGPTSGFFFNRLPATNNDLTTLFQGQIAIFVHTAISADTATISFPISLGPLTLRWKVRMKEAAEKNQVVGNADYHNTASGAVTNPLNWSAAVTKQSSIAAWSTLGVDTMATGGIMYAQLPPGYYMALLTVNYSATGAADWGWNASASATDYTVISSVNGATFTKLSGGAMSQNAWVHFKVTGAGTNAATGLFALFQSTGTSTGWTYSSGQFHLIAMPIGENTFLLHRDPTIRSLAFCRTRDGADAKEALRKQVAEELKAYGIERKEKKGEDVHLKRIEARHRELLATTRKASAIREWFDEQSGLDDESEADPDEKYELSLAPGPQLRAPDRSHSGRLFLHEAQAGAGELKSESKEERTRKEEEKLVPETIPAISRLLSSGWSLVRSEGTATASGQSAPARV